MTVKKYIVIFLSGNDTTTPVVCSTQEEADAYVVKQIGRSVKDYFEEQSIREDKRLDFDSMSDEELMTYGRAEDIVSETLIDMWNSKQNEKIRKVSFTGFSNQDDYEHYIIYPTVFELTSMDISDITAQKPVKLF